VPPKEDCRPSVGLPEEKRGVVRGAASPSYVPSIRLPAGPEALQMRSGSSDVKWSWEFEGACSALTVVRPATPGIRLARQSTKSVSRRSDKGAIGSSSGTSFGRPELGLQSRPFVTWLVTPIR
jgi:hypothetical protein